MCVCVRASPSHNRLLGCLERLATMRRTDVENPWLSRQGPPSSLLLLSLTKMEGWRDGVTELTSWITSNTPLHAGLPNLPPPPSLSITLCLSLSLYIFLCRGVYLSIFPSRLCRAQTQQCLALFSPLKHRPFSAPSVLRCVCLRVCIFV